MKADGKELVKYFLGDDTRYIIPVYQRNYSWKLTQCRQLLNDVHALIGNERKHFFGSVVRLSDGHNGWIVIDGQQRLTTVSLMWLAMFQLIIDNKREASNTLTNNLHNKFCYNKDDDTILPRIEHVDKDREAYEALIKGKKDKDKSTLQSEHTRDKEKSTLLTNGLYAKLNRSASDLIKYLQIIFNSLDLELESLIFHVKRKTNKEILPSNYSAPIDYDGAKS